MTLWVPGGTLFQRIFLMVRRFSGFQNQWRLLPLRSKFRHFSFHKLIGRSLEILNSCTVLKNHEPLHVKHGTCIFVPHDVCLRMRTTNLNLMMQKGNRVVQMITAHKSFHIIYIFKRWEQKSKVALAVELSILTSHSFKVYLF